METVLQVRRDMAALGWHSEDNLTNLGWGGVWGYRVWFYRFDWHGVRLGNRVSITLATTELERITDVVREAAETARRAWRSFPDSIPAQNVHGDLVAERLATDHFLLARNKLRKGGADGA